MIRFENRTNGRFYYMVVESESPDKFTLNIIRGGKYVRVITSIVCASLHVVNSELERLSKRRLKRGYSLVT